MSFKYIQEYYGVPAEKGRRVEVYGKPGIIVKAINQCIGVLLDCDKPTEIGPYHPTDGVKYLGKGKIRKMTVGQKRYQEYLSAQDWFDGSFAEWIGVK